MKIYKRLLSVLLVLVLVMTMFPASVFAYSWGSYGSIGLNSAKSFDLGTSWGCDMYSFTPSTTGYYTFYSSSKSSGDPYFYLSNSYSNIVNSIASAGCQNSTAANNALAYNDDSNGDGNFYLKYWCTAGTTYYCILTKYSTARTVASFRINGPYYSYATLNNQSATSAGTTGYYNDTGHNGLRGWLSTNATASFSSITIPAKSGYTFGGYYTGTEGTGTQYINASGSLLNVYNGTLYAKWTANAYNISFDRQSGTGGSANASVTYGSQIPASITVPTRTGYTFGGYYATTGGGGTQYYNAAGGRVYTSPWTTASGITLYAKWNANTYTLTLNNQGVTNGSESITNGSQFPATVTIPTRTGYNFVGYFGDINGAGTQYYNASGARIYNTAWNQDTGLTIYAKWERMTNTLYVDPNDGTWVYDGTSYTTQQSYTQPGTAKMTIPDPTNAKKPFLGWAKTGMGGALDGRVFTFDIGTPVTLTAMWGEAPSTEFQDNSGFGASGTDSNASDLEEVFNHIADDPDKGITLNDLSGDKEVTLTLIIDSATEAAPGASEIIGAAQGSTTQFFDISVEKTVSGEAPVRLSEIPVAVQIRVPLTGDLAGKLGYSVYRYHNGFAERLSPDVGAEEYFEVSENEIIIYTRKFSTYAVVAHETVLAWASEDDRLNDTNGEPGWDVQAIIKEGEGNQYKIDITWGSMVFDYSVSNSWNPDTHQYDGDKIYAWLPEGYFLNGNNKITAFNHSNRDVTVTFNVISLLNGVDMEVRKENTDEAALAVDMMLYKVPVAGAEAPFIEAYLRLTGTPEDTTKQDTYEKAGVITATIAVVPDSDITPE